MRKKVDVNSSNTIEINKGEFDSAATDSMTVVSKYAKTMGLTPSMLYRKDNKVYRISEDGSISLIPEGSTILIHNTYDLRDILYVLLTFSGLDINVVVGAWGFKYYAKDNLEKLKKVLGMAKVLGCEVTNISQPLEKDNILCDSFSLNTKKIKDNISSVELLTGREKDILTNFYKNSYIKEAEEPTNNITRRR